MVLSTLKERIQGRVPFLNPLHVLDEKDRKRAEILQERADRYEAEGKTDDAARVRAQVQGMLNRANTDRGISKRDKIQSRKATMRMIKNRK